MKSDYVEFVQLRDVPVLHRPKWWDRPRWWLVKLLGGQNPNDYVKIDRIPVHGKTFMDRLFKQKRYLYDRFNCRDPQTLLVGGEDYEQLMDSPEIRQAFQFSAFYMHGRDGICGLNVQVVPWMRGMVVMP